MCKCGRRHFITGLATMPLVLAGCGAEAKGPEPIKYGRDVCANCGMIISDPHYAAEVRGGPDKKLVKFDDLGDAILWIERQPWQATGLLEFWVMDSDTGKDWLEAKHAYFVGGAVTPMNYGYVAVKDNRPGALDFDGMKKLVLSNVCNEPGHSHTSG